MAAADIATLRVLIVDNHELIRTSLAIELNRYTDLEVVGVAADGEKAIALTQQLQPDVIIMDLRMPVMDGLTASKHIKQSYPDIRIIAYTSMNDPQAEVMAQTVPIDQFCYKDIETKVLVDLIRQVAGWQQPSSQNHREGLNDERH